MFCPKCGSEVKGNDKFCGKCGTLLNSAVSDNIKEPKTEKAEGNATAQKIIAGAGSTVGGIWSKIQKWLANYLDTWRQLQKLGEKEKYLWFGVHAGVALLFCGVVIALAVSGTDSRASEEMGEMIALEQETEENLKEMPGNENMDDGAAEYSEPVKETYATLEVKGGTCVAGGDCIFGSYEMSAGAGKVDFEWIILEVTDNKAFLLSKYILPELRAFNNVTDLKTVARWDGCSLRTWLNDSFYSDAFTDEQKAAIITTQVGDYDLRMGGSTNYTQDKIFCLSTKEASKYIDDLNSLLVGTFYGSDTAMTWWLRTEAEVDMNSAGKYASFITAEGIVKKAGFHNYQEIGVRPAMWIDLDMVSVVSY